MKRLLCIVGGMNAGGAETFLMKIYRNLDKSKYQMDFAVAVQEEGFYDKEIANMGGKIYHITPKSKGVIKNLKDISNIVKKNNYVYVLRTSQHSLSALELYAAKVGGAKVRVFRSSNSNTTTGSKKELILHSICRFMPMLFANIRIAPSTEAAEFMFGNNCIVKGRAKIIHNAVDIDAYKFDNEVRKQVRKELEIENCFVWGHVGRFNQQKNHKFLIDQFYEFCIENPDSKLVLVGKGELENDVRTQVDKYGISDKVLFLGVRNDVTRLLCAFDVFVFPSLYEGMPNTVIEAQATGLPCVISDKITREVKITEEVEFLSLNNTAAWGECVNDKRNKKRNSVKEQFITNRYDIESTVQDFIKTVFR